jgi:hypothetical protein
MNKPLAFAIAIHMPHFANEKNDDDDYNGNDNERGGAGDSGGSLGETVISAIASLLEGGGRAEIEAVHALSQCLERVADAVADDDASAVNRWCERAAGLLDVMLEGHKGK